MTEDVHQRIERERNDALPDAKLVTEFRNYARGLQRITLSAEQRKMLGQVMGHRFADNACKAILRSIAGRVSLTGFAVDNATVQAYLDTLWITAGLDNVAAQVHFAAPRDGNAAISLNWKPGRASNPGRVTIHREPWWNGETGVFIAYDTAGEKAYAVKDFEAWAGSPPAKLMRRTIYYPDAIERYIRRGDGWRPYPDEASYRSAWVKRTGQPLNIPIVHVVYDADHDTDYGVSDLDGGILGLQDELNDIQRDITAAARLTGYQQYFLKGVVRELDANGKEKRYTPGPGTVHQAGSPDADMKVLGAGDISQLISAHGHKLQTIAHNTSTPLHLITGGDWPSGTALLRADMPLVVKADRFITSITPAWAEVSHRATEIANTFGGVGLDETAMIAPVFEDTEKPDDLTRVQVQQETITMYRDLMGLPETLIRKTGVLTKDELVSALGEREAGRLQAERALNAGMINPTFEDEEGETA